MKKQFEETRNIRPSLFNADGTVKLAVKQEWISVDVRLPETNEEVLVYSSVGKIYTACYIRVDGIEFWFENIDGFREITHWMPLPEAPKMKGEKNG